MKQNQRALRQLWRLAIGACITFSMGQAYADSLEQHFTEPPIEHRPWVRWWWPGAAVDQAELVREIQLLQATGFGGAEIQSMMPNMVRLSSEDQARVHDYAESSFFAAVTATGNAAQAAGMQLDYTLGSAWPSGGGFAITPEKAMLELTMGHTQVEAGAQDVIRLDIPKQTKRLGALNSMDPRVKDPRVSDWRDRLNARAKIVAVVAMKGTWPELKAAGATAGFKLYPWDDVIKPGQLDFSSHLVLTDKLGADGVLNWTPPSGVWQVLVFKQYTSDMGVLGSAGRGPQLVLDHMDKSAFEAHVQRVGAPLGKKPAALRSTFVDSLELMQDLPWTENFLDEFKHRRGYDLTPYLPFVLQPGWMQAWGEHYSPPYFVTSDSLSERVRVDYRRTVSDLMFDGFITPFIAWNHAQGIKAKFQAHGGAIDILRAYGAVDIPETEDLPHHGDPHFMRMARSAANLYGKKIVSAESLVWKDRPYDVTPDEMRKKADLIFSGGVNSLMLHGTNYRLPTNDWPGWHAFQPTPFGAGFSSMLNETNPVWPAVKPLATYLARIQTLLQSGDSVVPIAYFYGHTGFYIGIEDQGQGEQFFEKQFIAHGYDYDRINPHALAATKVKAGKLRSSGGADYSALVIPELDGISAESAEIIASIAKKGVPVFFVNKTPTRDEGLDQAKKRDQRVQKAMAAALKAGAQVVQPTLLIQALQTHKVPANLHFAAGSVNDVIFVQRELEDKTITFILNAGSEARDASFSLSGGGSISRWYGMDGRIVPLKSQTLGNRLQVPLMLAGQESALLVQAKNGSVTVKPAQWQQVDQMVLPTNGWKLGLDGHVLRKPYRAQLDQQSLGEWQLQADLKNFAGKGTYSRSVKINPDFLVKNKRVILKLEKVSDIAEVSINGHFVTTLFSTPFETDITDYLQTGENQVELTVYNTPQNSMLNPKAAGYKLLKPVPAGLIGPVTIITQVVAN